MKVTAVPRATTGATLLTGSVDVTVTAVTVPDGVFPGVGGVGAEGEEPQAAATTTMNAASTPVNRTCDRESVVGRRMIR